MPVVGQFFGTLIKRHRESRGISGYLICQVTGMPQPTFIALEKGRRPPSDANLEAIASVLDVLAHGTADPAHRRRAFDGLILSVTLRQTSAPGARPQTLAVERLLLLSGDPL